MESRDVSPALFALAGGLWNADSTQARERLIASALNRFGIQ